MALKLVVATLVGLVAGSLLTDGRSASPTSIELPRQPREEQARGALTMATNGLSQRTRGGFLRRLVDQAGQASRSSRTGLSSMVAR
jgi:hypothetical protein